MSENSSKHVYRLCPCDSSDVEGLQSWLEDLASEGLFLVEDGVFCGVFSFERKAPRNVTYRLDVAQKRKPRFMDSGDGLTEEELELYRSLGWEYLLRYGDFHIYRSMQNGAPELNTETETHAITISLLKRKHRSAFVSSILSALFWLLWAQGFLRYGYRMAAEFGLTFTLCLYGFWLWTVISPLLRAFRFRRYEKRLLKGDSLNHRVDWKRTAPVSLFARTLPILLCCGIVVGLASPLVRSGTELPQDAYPGDPPFATVADAFPGGTVSKNNVWLDYGTYKTGETSLSKNIEWNESCDVRTADGETYFCILRLTYHETASDWIARGLEQDYYIYDSTRYHGKRFEELTPPQLGVDSIRVYNNYGSLCVLMRQGSRVVHAVVTADNQNDQNEWLLWAQAMAQMLLQ